MSATSSVHSQKTNHYSDKLQHADNKNMFSIMKSLSGKPSPSYPENGFAMDCCNAFSDYFNDKVAKICLGLHGAGGRITSPREARCFVTPVDTFTPTTVRDITAIIMRTCKTCMLDMLHFYHVKQTIDGLAIIVAGVTNACLAEGIMPTEQK